MLKADLAMTTTCPVTLLIEDADASSSVQAAEYETRSAQDQIRGGSDKIRCAAQSRNTYILPITGIQRRGRHRHLRRRWPLAAFATSRGKPALSSETPSLYATVGGGCAFARGASELGRRPPPRPTGRTGARDTSFVRSQDDANHLKTKITSTVSADRSAAAVTRRSGDRGQTVCPF